jgi:16S rRNA (guanine527-N7)-methyltransferase
LNAREFTVRLRRRARRAGVTVSDALAAQLWVYIELLFRWNSKINLTSLSLEQPDEAIDRLLVEPLAAARHLPSEARSLIDIGSGGGSPAIPLKLAHAAVRLVMVESKARKSAFLREALRQLESDGTVETARFEELLTRPDMHETFDVLTLRAVRTERRTLLSLQAFVRPTGRLFLFRADAGEGSSQSLVPPLRWEAAYPLGPNSSLAVVQKLAIP